MNAAEKYEQIIDAITKLTSPEFVRELDGMDGLKALDDLLYQTYPSPDEDDDWEDYEEDYLEEWEEDEDGEWDELVQYDEYPNGGPLI